MRRLPLAAAALAVLMSAACTTDPGPDSGRAKSRPGTTAVPPAQVVRPWHDGEPEYGINVYWENTADDSDEVIRAKAARILDYVVGLDANSVTFSFPFFTKGLRSTSLRAGNRTPTPQGLAIAVEEAKRRALRTSVRPILNEKALTEDNPQAWRGMITPASRDAWFANYRKLLLPYAKASAKADTFVVGTEFNSLEGDPRWKRVVTAVRDVFPGEVAYSANFDTFQKGDVDVPADVIGVDAYPRFDLDEDATAEDIAAEWSGWLREHDDNGPPVLHEAGIAAQNGALRKPGHWGDGSRELNLSVQKRWYEGICTALRDGDAAGVYWWKVDFDADPEKAAKDSADRMTFVGRPVEKTIKKCFRTAP